MLCLKIKAKLLIITYLYELQLLRKKKNIGSLQKQFMLRKKRNKTERKK